MKLLIFIVMFFAKDVLSFEESYSYAERWDQIETLLRYSSEAAQGHEARVKSYASLTRIGGLPTSIIANLVEGIAKNIIALAGSYNTTQACLNDTETLFRGIISTEYWALKILDSWAKPPAGILEYDVRWLGNFDECRNATVPQITASNRDGFKTQYCPVNLKVKALDTTPAVLLGGASIALGMCLPKSCTVPDVYKITYAVLQQLPKNNITNGLTIGYAYCKEDYLEITPLAIGCIFLLTVLGIFMVVGTVFDLYIRHKVRNSFNSEPSLVAKQDLDSGRTSKFENNNEDDFGKVLQKEVNNLHTALKILLAFSIYTNAAKILTVSQNTEGQLTVIHGIRFFSMSWVILGHSFFQIGGYASNLYPYIILTKLKQWTWFVVMNASFSVDSFFVMSGCLLAYLTFKEFNKKGGPRHINWFLFYFHRYWRLTSTYALVLFCHVSLSKYLSTGPMSAGKEFEEPCLNTWWTNLLYVNNVVKTKEMCMGWTWYLANDMQFYIISPIILVGFYYHWIIGSGISFVLILVDCISTGIISTQKEIGMLDPKGQAFDNIYIKPYCRVGSYMVGILLGYVLHAHSVKKFSLHWIYTLIGWCLAIVFCISTLYGVRDAYNGTEVSLEVGSFYQAMSRVIWSLGVAWVIFACTTGNGGWVNTLLSWSALVPLSRMTYCAYLIHMVMINAIYADSRKTYYLTDLGMVQIFLGNLFISYMVAFVCSLAFEAPLIGIERILLRPAVSSKSRAKTKSFRGEKVDNGITNPQMENGHVDNGADNTEINLEGRLEKSLIN